MNKFCKKRKNLAEAGIGEGGLFRKVVFRERESLRASC
jgi:hypothetical protein